MVKFLAHTFIKLIFILDRFSKIIKVTSFADFIFNHLNEKMYKKEIAVIKFNNKEIKLTSNNPILKYRSETFFSKEPETLKWIDNFDKSFNSFWDIGANVGLYSLYAATQHINKEIVSFEPSTNNLKILSTNIAINNLQNYIKLVPFGLGKNINFFYIMNESSNVEGSANHSLGDNLNYRGEYFTPTKQYQVYGTTVDQLIASNALISPQYIKIDVDGFEHHILEGSKSLISSGNVKSFLIEINENFIKQFNKIMFYLKENYKITAKHQLYKKEKLSNYIFEKK